MATKEQKQAYEAIRTDETTVYGPYADAADLIAASIEKESDHG